MHAEFAARDALMIPYGSGDSAVDVVGAFEEVGIEYAAIRKGCVLFDMPHAGTVEVRGAEALDFLNNMVTQRVDDLADGRNRRSFWLNRKGRIDADMRITAIDGRVLLALDRHIADATAEALNAYLFSEDAEISDVSDAYHRMALHGVGALGALARASGQPGPDIGIGQSRAVQIAGAQVFVDREDLTGDPGLELCVPRGDAERVYSALLGTGEDRPGVKPAGWFAINTARIEAGRPIFNTDFGTDNLPMESGVIESRVDFKKGCYLGQEVVARMDARKVRKRGLASVRINPDGSGQAPLPSQGERVLESDGPDAGVIGSVTSSTIAPMASGASVAFAMLRDKETKPGTEIVIAAEGKRAVGVVQDGLAFWSRNA